MRRISALLAGTMLLVAATSAQADLLGEITNGDASGTIAMTATELDSVVGEGTYVKFVDIPNLARSFDRTIEAGPNTITISAVAGVGITITLDGPNVPSM